MFPYFVFCNEKITLNHKHAPYSVLNLRILSPTSYSLRKRWKTKKFTERTLIKIFLNVPHQTGISICSIKGWILINFFNFRAFFPPFLLFLGLFVLVGRSEQRVESNYIKFLIDSNELVAERSYSDANEITYFSA